MALDLACGPGAISQRLLQRFPKARCIALDIDPVLVTMGQQVLGDMDGRLRWVEANLAEPEWVNKLGEGQVDAVLSTTALHWLPAQHLVRLYQELGKLVRPGGVVLNGDNLPFAPHLPSLQTVADKYNEQAQQQSFQAEGIENWEQWWAGLAQEEGVQELLAERRRRFAWLDWQRDVGRTPNVDLHEAALRNAGFREVGVLWQNLDDRIVIAVR